MSQNPPERAGNARSNLRLRIVSGIVLGIIVLAVTFIGGAVFRLFSAALAILILYEWLGMRSAISRSGKALAWGTLLIAVAVLVAGVSVLVSLSVLAVAVLVMLVHGTFSGDGTWTGAGVAYAGVPVIALAAMRGNDAAGLWAILFLFAVVWATDVLAYFVGRAVGGAKLAPSISPGKTWSGAMGGALGAVIAGGAVAWLGNTVLSLFSMCLLAIVLSVASQFGDLFESALKRRHGVKDSSTLIPGHGGVMDRVDGLVAAAVVFYFTALIFAGFDAPAAGFFSR